MRLAHDQVDDPAQLLLILEVLVHPCQTAAALHKDVVGTIDHHFCHIFICKNGIQQAAQTTVHFINAVDGIHLLDWEQVSTPSFPFHQSCDCLQQFLVVHPGRLQLPVDGVQNSASECL